MRTKFLLFGVAVLPLVGGCNSANSAPDVATNAPTPAAVAPKAELAPTNSNIIAVEPPAARVVNQELAVPDSVKLSPAATEVAKMARAGVDPSVMQAYVANSVNTYQLTADEIVYLNDLGLAPEVVSAMIQHDQQIREASLNGAMAASPATPAPGGSVWQNSAPANPSNVWQETAIAPAPESVVETTVPPPPEQERPAEVTVNYFYDSLSPYGTWIDIDGYGRCWRPTVVATTPGWRPYVHNGRWMWTDAGWYWYSDYSWGWAPFHYGRWFSHATWGWCWVPGTVWGPSWVSWRYNDGYCGWAPLPPAAYYYPSVGFTYYGRSCGTGFSFGLTWDSFTFVSYNRFHGRYYDRYCAPRHQAANIYNNSTVINNVIVGDNNTIINQGISPARISSVTQTEIPRATVRQLAAAQPGRGRNEILAADGKTVSVVQHQVPGGRAPVRGGATLAAATEPITAPAPELSEPATTTRSGPTRPSSAAPSIRNDYNAVSTRNSGVTRGSAGASPTAPAASEAPITAAAPMAATASAATASTTTTRPGVTKTPGALYIRGNPNQPTTAQVATEPTTQPAAPTATPAAAPSRATPWLNNSVKATDRPTRSTWQTPANSTPEFATETVRPGVQQSPSNVRQSGNNNYATPSPAVSVPPPSRVTTIHATPTPSTVWAETPPTRPNSRTFGNSGSTRPEKYSAPVRSAPSYTPPAPVSSPAPVRMTPAPATPAPVIRPPQAAPAPSSPRATYSAPPRSAPASAPPSRSAPTSSKGSDNSGSRPGRPGK